MRKYFILSSILIISSSLIIGFFHTWIWKFTLIWGPLFIIGMRDITQHKHAILRNFPIIGHLRYIFEMIRPEINQYFIESNTDGKPFGREQRALVYQRSKKQSESLPFGTQRDVYLIGHEWVNHSSHPIHRPYEHYRVKIGGDDCKKPYNASLFNISAMSYGSLSDSAVLA
jgi:glutamate synthase domain-containing protein 2